MLPTRKSKSLWWILGVLLCLLAFSAARPSSPAPALSTANNATDKSTSETRDDKANQPAIGESIKMVANQLLQSNKTPPPTTSDGGIVEDIRTPPKMKNQQMNKSKTPKPSPYTAKPQVIENSNAGVAVPVVEIEKPKNNKNVSETSTSSEGLSTWVLLSEGSTTSMPNVSTPKSKIVLVDDKNKSDVDSSETKKPVTNKPKPKPTPKPTLIRATTTVAPKPIFNRKPVAIVSANKSDLIASGSAVNENVMNKIKASVLANVQKNKAAALNKTASKVATESSSTVAATVSTPSTQAVTETTKMAIETSTKKITPPKLEKVEISTKKSPKLSNKNKVKENEVLDNKRKEIEIEVVSSNASLESKEAEIELEVSTPAPTTKKPKRKTTSKKKKNKNRRRKPVQESTTSKPEVITAVESKISPSNNTKAAQKVPSKEKPITTQLYNYFSREVMPSVGVGLVSLAGIVGLASYFLYPFSSVVRRAYDTNDRKDDIYQQNGELYATADGGQTEEEMLGTFFPEVPESNKKINPYAGQTQFHYPQKKAQTQEQNIRYRNVAYGSEANSFVPSNRVGQHSVDTIHGAAYSEQIHYDTHVPKHSDPYTVYPQGQPVYSPNVQENPDNTYVTDSVQASYMTQDGGPEPAYGQAYNYGQQEFDYNNQPEPQAPVAEALHMGVEDVIEHQKETGYTVAPSETDDNKHPFVVGNIPKELIQAVTPVSVPEHGPRGFRFKRDVRAEKIVGVGIPKFKSIGDSLEEFLKEARKDDKNHEYSNEIDEALGLPKKDPQPENETTVTIHLVSETTTTTQNPESKDHTKTDKKKKVPENHTDKKIPNVLKSTTIYLSEQPLTNEVNTVSIANENLATTTSKPSFTELQETTKKNDENMIIIVAQKMQDPLESITVKSKLGESESVPLSTSTLAPSKSTTSGFGSVDTSTSKDFIASSTYKYEDPLNIKFGSVDTSTSKDYISSTTYNYEDQTYTEEMYPDTYPPVYYEPKPFSILGLIRNLIEFKVRLGLGILQSTTETIARYLKGVESNISHAAKASANVHHHYQRQKE